MADSQPRPNAPASPERADDREIADIVQRGGKALAGQHDVHLFGAAVWCFSKEEHAALEELKRIVEGYLGQPKPKRPLCIAVFGPPGSGKSFGVEQLCKELAKAGKYKLPQTTINLTQIPSTVALARELVGVRVKTAPDEIPFVLFDEFDTARDGATLGWLSWFLAPMQDAKFEADKQVELTRAIYVFAGGTAASMAEFERRRGDAFRAAKGPDFLSRLRAYLDVRGPNDPKNLERRRALALWIALDTVSKVQDRPLALSDDLRGALVRVGRFRHGQRSVEAVIEMAAARGPRDPNEKPDDKKKALVLERRHLPHDSILTMHADRGPLDPAVIGGLIGLSAGRLLDDTGKDAGTAMWAALADMLWSLGGTLAFGGKPSDAGFLHQLLDGLARLPMPLSASREKDDAVRVEVFANERRGPVKDPRVAVIAVPPPRATPATAPAAHYFRMRWQSGSRCVARILMSGKTKDFHGRMPGILEEAMVALALRQPIYVLGGFGGGAAVLGELLGLAREFTTQEQQLGKPIPAAERHLFAPPGFPDLPLTHEEALSWLAGHAIGGPRWPDNGLSVEENRALFALTDSEEDRKTAVGLIRDGLLRVFAR
jgi:hypothetical protein